MYRETKKTRTKRSKKETGQQYANRVNELYLDPDSDNYREYKITFTNEELNHYRYEKLKLDMSIKQSFTFLQLDQWQRNSNECIGKFGPCDYLPLCSGSCDNINDLYRHNSKEPLDNGKYRKKIFGDTTA
jgi:radical SAM protein with 4Fe4S-binding SPASM domain